MASLLASYLATMAVVRGARSWMSFGSSFFRRVNEGFRLPHFVFMESEMSRRILRSDHDRRHIFGCGGLVGTSSTFYLVYCSPLELEFSCRQYFHLSLLHGLCQWPPGEIGVDGSRRSDDDDTPNGNLHSCIFHDHMSVSFG